ncbi:DNA-binding FadR family transcriptional regulator [Mycoplana sp. BE70]|uniref:FadR/GntR family transcriptional regulator n=1 Tax=Mycoplana sp. BE70 TaxID=2817775 RepID=UPI002861A51F|nr:FadR/GntR family transcriptional regulator [Mycoplana sp. BE70]MDR6759093.1 DNA-binding FadR family transcriptional regulator [Mycoplana sp. BE70]
MDDEPRKSAKPRTLSRRAAAVKIRARPIVRPVRLSDQVIESLRNDIESGRSAPGSRLPTEKELTESFNVSRTVIREAISRLQTDGLVLAKQGSGIYVADPTEVARSFRLGVEDSEQKTSIREIYELRIGVESEAAALAAVRRTKTDLTLLERALKALASAKNFDGGVDADITFHRLIAQLSKNSAILRFQEFLAAMLGEAIKVARGNSARHSGLAEKVLDEHVRIFEAIAAGDAEEARRAARHHLVNAQERLNLHQKHG